MSFNQMNGVQPSSKQANVNTYFTSKSCLNSSTIKSSILSDGCIKLFSEKSGFYDLNENVFRLLSEDVTYRIREVLSNSANLMRKLNKEKLSVNNVNTVLKWYNNKPVYGYESTESNFFKDQNVLLDNEINIAENSNLIINGKRKQFLKIKNAKMLIERVQLKSLNSDNITDSNLSSNLKDYFNFVTNNLFCDDFQVFEKLLEDINHNKEIQDLLYFFTKFFIETIYCENKNDDDLFRVILFLDAFLRNDNFITKIQTYLIEIIDLVIHCLIGNLRETSNLEIRWNLREYSAKLLVKILNRWQCLLSNSNILCLILNIMISKFTTSKNLDVHYGITIFFSNFNPSFLFNIFYPYLISYLETLDNKKYESTLNDEESKLYETFFFCVINFLNIQIHEKNFFVLNQCYDNLFKIFGEALLSKLTTINI